MRGVRASFGWQQNPRRQPAPRVLCVLGLQPYFAILVAAKFPADFVQQIRSAADAVQGSLKARAGKGLARTGATKQIAATTRQGRRAVAAVDSIVSHLILGDERLEREWRAAKRVRRAATATEAENQGAAPASGTMITTRAIPNAPQAPEVGKAAA